MGLPGDTNQRNDASQTRFVDHLKALVADGRFHATGIYDDDRFNRSVRAHLRSLQAKAQTNSGFDTFSRF